MKEDRLTREQILEARLATLERRIEQMESWTGADEDGNWNGKEASVDEKLLAHELIIAHLLQHLQFLVPSFSIERVREGLHMTLEKAHANGAESIDTKWREIIDDLLPEPALQDQPPARNRSRPTLVPTVADAREGDE
ncbi:hypothetical protein [Rhizobium sp. 18055]|uniref:hypothetical protein n=1 Tax=Rhizobium sp. 18055 TaxID=2681403 RepID=UPI001359B8D3|nr:hypothetical protein [Rhizobium sp. 18055]